MCSITITKWGNTCRAAQRLHVYYNKAISFQINTEFDQFNS